MQESRGLYGCVRTKCFVVWKDVSHESGYLGNIVVANEEEEEVVHK